MMKTPEDYESMIARYLEGKMNADEEVIFMQDLDSNEELRKQYEQELLISALFNNDENDADSLSSAYKQNPEAGSNEKQKSLLNISSSFKWYKYLAAAVLLIAILLSVFFIIQRKNLQPPFAKSDTPNNTISKADSSNNSIPGNKNHDSLGKSLFDKYYTEYIAKNDPVEISNYYDYYKNKNYNKVILATQSDYEVMGISDRKDSLNAYMFLYKGLSYLGNNNIADAIKSFDSVLNFAAKNEKLYYDAQWYYALSYLKENKIQDADSVLKKIMENSSPYKSKAEQIVNKLN